MFSFWIFCVTMETIHELSVCEWFVVFDGAKFWWSKSLHDPFFECVQKFQNFFPLGFSAQFSHIGFSFFSLITSIILIFVLSVALASCNCSASSSGYVVVVIGYPGLSWKWSFSIWHFIQCKVANRQIYFQHDIC